MCTYIYMCVCRQACGRFVCEMLRHHRLLASPAHCMYIQYIHTHTHTHTHTHLHTHIHVSTYIHIYQYMYIWRYVYIYIYSYADYSY